MESFHHTTQASAALWAASLQLPRIDHWNSFNLTAFVWSLLRLELLKLPLHSPVLWACVINGTHHFPLSTSANSGCINASLGITFTLLCRTFAFLSLFIYFFNRRKVVDALSGETCQFLSCFHHFCLSTTLHQWTNFPGGFLPAVY